MSLKYPVLTTTLGLFGAVCLAGVGLAGWQFSVYSGNSKTLKKTLAQRDAIFSAEIAPTKDNLELAKDNYKEIQERNDELFKLLKNEFEFRGETVSQPADLVAKLRESNDRLLRDIQNAKARIFRASGRASDFGFGFRRYVTATDGTTPRSRLDEIGVQKDVVEFLVQALLVAKNEVGSKAPLIIQSVQREPIEVPIEKGSLSQRGNADEYIPLPNEVLRRDGIAKSYFFRITFTARTNLLRAFVNTVDGKKAPLFLRSVTIAPAKPEVLAPPVEEGATDASGAPIAAVPGIPGATDPAAAPASPFTAAAPTALAGFGDPATATPAFPGTPAAAAPAPAPAAPVSNTEIILESKPSEFTVTFEYLMPEPFVENPATSPSTNN
jgi:hypothetical protein